MSIILPLTLMTADGAKLSRLFHASLQLRNAKNRDLLPARLAEEMLCESTSDTCECTRAFGGRVGPKPGEPAGGVRGSGVLIARVLACESDIGRSARRIPEPLLEAAPL